MILIVRHQFLLYNGLLENRKIQAIMMRKRQFHKKPFPEKYVLFMTIVLAFFTYPATANGQSLAPADVILGVGDRIIVRIAVEPKYSGEYTIDERGKFYLPILDEGLDFGAFEVAGLTTKQLTELLKDRLSEFYAQGEIAVELVSLGVRPGQAVSVFGMVITSGSFRYFEGMKFLDLMLKTGNFTDDADLTKIALYRDNEPIRYIDIRGLVNGTDLTNNIALRPGDYLIVPKQIPSMKMKVIVLGRVGSPGTTFVPEGTQLLDLIARVGGTQGRAAISKTYIIRVVDGNPIAIHADLKALLSRMDLKENIEIKDGDIVFVPESSKIDISKIISNLVQLDILRNLTTDDSE